MKLTQLLLAVATAFIVFPALIGCDGETPEQKAAYDAAQQQRAASRPGAQTPSQPGVAPGTENNAGK